MFCCTYRTSEYTPYTRESHAVIMEQMRMVYATLGVDMPKVPELQIE